jgi:hypothetical protein
MIPIFGYIDAIKRITLLEQDTVKQTWTYHLEERYPDYWIENGNMKLISDVNKWVRPTGDELSSTFKKTLQALISRANRAQQDCNSAKKSPMVKNDVWKLRKLKPQTKKWIKTLPG